MAGDEPVVQGVFVDADQEGQYMVIVFRPVRSMQPNTLRLRPSEQTADSLAKLHVLAGKLNEDVLPR